MKKILNALAAFAATGFAFAAPAPWVGLVPAPEPEEPVEVAPIQEEPVYREEPTEYVTLKRNINKNLATPFFARVFSPDAESLPPGGRKAVKRAVQEMFYGRSLPYWIEDLKSDLDLESEHFLYRAMVMRALADWRLKGCDAPKVIVSAKELYQRRRSEENPLAAAELASAIILAETGEDVAESPFKTNLYEDVERAVTNRSICGEDTVEYVAHLINLWKLNESSELLERLEARAGEIDEWLMEHLRGSVKYREAWNVRGRGYARTVTSDGWKGFGPLMREAERHMRRAYTLRPDILVSSSALCRLETPNATKAEQREWRHTGFAARLDVRNIRASRLFHLTSRWGGSVEKMEKSLDKIAPADGDFGTVVPGYNVSLRWTSIAKNECDDRDLDTREEFFLRPGVKDKTLAVIREYLKSGSSLWLESALVRDELLCDFAAAAYCCREYALMAECWRRITPGVARARFVVRHCERPLAFEDQTMRWRLPFLVDQARYPKRFAAISEASCEIHDGDFTNGLARLSAIGNAEPADSPVRSQLANDMGQAIYRRVCETGETISLMDDLLTSGDPKSAIYRTPERLYGYDPDRTAFRATGQFKERTYAVKGIRRDFSGSTGWTFKPPDPFFKGSGTMVEFWLGPMFMMPEDAAPVLRIISWGVDEWKVDVWEKNYEWDSRGRFGRIPQRILVKPVMLKANERGEFDIRADFDDGRLRFFVNGVQVTKKPLNFAFDGENDWYDFCFHQRSADVTEHWLGPTPRAAGESDEPDGPALPQFASQYALLPLPTMAYATNEVVRAAARDGREVFPEYGLFGTWWGTEFNSSELNAMKPKICETLDAALTNEVWAAMDEAMRGPLAFRFAALAYQAGEKGLAAEFIERFVPEGVVFDSQSLAVSDLRYDDASNPGGHGMILRRRLWGDCTSLRAAWWRACTTGERTRAERAIGQMRCMPTGTNDARDYTGYALSGTDDWKLSIRASGGLYFGSLFGKGISPVTKSRHLLDLQISKGSKPGYAQACLQQRRYVPSEKGSRVLDEKIGEPCEFPLEPDGTFVCEIVNRGGRILYLAGGVEVGSTPSPGKWEGYKNSEEGAGYVPSCLQSQGGEVKEVWLERLDAKNGGEEK